MKSVADPLPLSLRPKPRWLLGAVAWAACAWVQAVEVDGFRALSARGEPLHAQVRLREVSPEDWPGLRVQLSSAGAYQAAQLQRPSELDSLQVSLQQGEGNTATVELRTTQAISQAVLDVLLDVTWPSGQLSHQFSAILQGPEAQASSTRSPSAAAQAAVTVVRGDTLSELMITHRYGMGTMAQRLIATQRANPQAFIRNNVNWVRAGARLRLPSREAILAIDAREAQALIDAQMADFDAYRRGLAQRAQAAQTLQQQGQGSVEMALQGGTTSPQGDRLALTQAQVAADAQEAERQALAAAQSRQAELSRNLRELQTLNDALAAAGAGGAPGGSSASQAGGNGTATDQAGAKTPGLTLDAGTGAPAAAAKRSQQLQTLSTQIQAIAQALPSSTNAVTDAQAAKASSGSTGAAPSSTSTTGAAAEASGASDAPAASPTSDEIKRELQTLAQTLQDLSQSPAPSDDAAALAAQQAQLQNLTQRLETLSQALPSDAKDPAAAAVTQEAQKALKQVARELRAVAQQPVAQATDGAEPQWIRDLRQQSWLLPGVGVLLLLLALWVWRRRQATDREATHDAAPPQPHSDATPQNEADVLPTLDPEGTAADGSARPLSALLPDVDLDLPDLPNPPEEAPTGAELLEQAKAKFREGDTDAARALAEEALASSDPMIQGNAKAFLERL
jgi:pilus assembly protein FimV